MRIAEPPRAEGLLHDLMDRHRDRLLRYVNRLTGDAHRAEDIVQETMLRCWTTRGEAQFSPPERAAPWLFTVARNLAVDAHRRDRAVPMGSLPTEVLQRPERTDIADTVADRQLLHQALDRLSPEHREVLIQVLVHDRTGAQAAQALGIPVGTVKSRVHYALSAMRRELEPLQRERAARRARQSATRPVRHTAGHQNAGHQSPGHPAAGHRGRGRPGQLRQRPQEQQPA